MKRVSEAIRKGTDGLPRQKRYQIVRFRSGECINCGVPRGDSTFKRLCQKCGEGRRAPRNARTGFKPWVPGGPGRPPLKRVSK